MATEVPAAHGPTGSTMDRNTYSNSPSYPSDRLAHPDANVLDLRELMQTVEAASAAETALFVTPIRPLRRDKTDLVDPYRSRLQLTCDTTGPKISICASPEELSTPPKTVGSM